MGGINQQISLKSERLYFRQLGREDFDLLKPILGDVETMYAWEYGFSEDQINEWIVGNLVRYTRDGYSYYAAIKRDTEELIGIMGLLNEDINGEILLGIGYIVRKQHWGQGYATEGSKTWISYAFDVLKSQQVIADIRPENKSSISVAKKLGMTKISQHIKHHNGKEMPHDVYAIKNK